MDTQYRKADRRMVKQVEGKKGRQTFTCKKTDIKEDMRTERHQENPTNKKADRQTKRQTD